MKKIKDTGKTLEKLDVEKIAKLLGAEIVPEPKWVKEMKKNLVKNQEHYNINDFEECKFCHGSGLIWHPTSEEYDELISEICEHCNGKGIVLT